MMEAPDSYRINIKTYTRDVYRVGQMSAKMILLEIRVSILKTYVKKRKR